MNKDTTNKPAVSKKSRKLQQQQRTRSMNPFDDMEQLFEGFFPRGWMQPMRRQWPEWGLLAADLYDDDKKVIVRLEALSK